jgi:hypothetical protein
VYAHAVGRLGYAGFALATAARICLRVLAVTASRAAGGFRKRCHRAWHLARLLPEPEAPNRIRFGAIPM